MQKQGSGYESKVAAETECWNSDLCHRQPVSRYLAWGERGAAKENILAESEKYFFE